MHQVASHMLGLNKRYSSHFPSLLINQGQALGFASRRTPRVVSTRTSFTSQTLGICLLIRPCGRLIYYCDPDLTIGDAFRQLRYIQISLGTWTT
jgi:hypothetical protein